MTNYAIGEVAAMAGISVRALHHYHEIGLLRPAHVGENGYRYYGREELLRLQQILIHRELGLPLAEIANLLGAPTFDRLAALRSYRERAAHELARFTEMLATIDRTIAELQGEYVMKDTQLYSGIVDPTKQAAYEAWLEQRYGTDIRHDIENSRRKWDRQSPFERDGMMTELKDIEQSLAAALRAGVSPEAPSLDPLIARHYAWVESSWNRALPLSAYLGLADLYLAHADFVARYESIEPDFAEFLTTAMRSWVQRQP
jgi:MerR family transcriptional regulator, thiopeptide resistance regulator